MIVSVYGNYRLRDEVLAGYRQRESGASRERARRRKRSNLRHAARVSVNRERKWKRHSATRLRRRHLHLRHAPILNQDGRYQHSECRRTDENGGRKARIARRSKRLAVPVDG